MKATGIIRRTDDLGRVVIPKEIRRTLRIREGDPLEIFIEKDCVCFKKYSALGSLDEETLRIAQSMAQQTFKHQIAIYDDVCKISGPNSYNSYVDADWEKNKTPFRDKGMGTYPIISDGELYGYVRCLESDMSAEMTMIVRYLSAAVGD
mgnify:CR=1 FL=1